MIPYKGWALIELMGRRAIVGHVAGTCSGTTLLHIDVPTGRTLKPTRPQFHRADKCIFSICAITEEEALRHLAPPPPPALPAVFAPDRLTEEEEIITKLETQVRELLEGVDNAAAGEVSIAALQAVPALRETIAALDKSRDEDDAMAAELAAEEASG